MDFLRWMNRPITYVYLAFAIVLFVMTINAEPSRFDPSPEPKKADPFVAFLILSVGLFAVRFGWAVVKIIGGSYISAMTQKPGRLDHKPFSFWDY